MPKIKALDSISGLNVKIQAAIQAIPISDRYFIALSGGMDSVALLYFCLPYLKLHTKDIQVIHVNHGLSPNANTWSEFCRDFCNHLGLLCYIEEVKVVSGGKGVEAAARKARYEVFDRYLEQGGVLLQGHHLNDQAETVLMRVIKGLGPEALKGIPQTRAISKGFVYRPWLHITRELIESSVKNENLSWVEDESNLDIHFDRNYLRHEVLPILDKKRPSILNDLARVAKKSRDTVEFIQEWCEQSTHQFLSLKYSEYQAIDLTNLVKFSKIQQKVFIRYWFDLLGVAHPNESSFLRIFDELLMASDSSQAEISWNNNVLRVFDEALFCLPLSKVDKLKAEEQTSINVLLGKLNNPLCLKFSSWKLTITLVKSCDIDSFFQNKKNNRHAHSYEVICQLPESISELTIKFRQGGEKIYLHQGHSASLKKLYQIEKILPWMRDKLPLIYIKEELICAVAGFVAGRYQLDQQNNYKHLNPKIFIHFLFDPS